MELGTIVLGRKRSLGKDFSAIKGCMYGLHGWRYIRRRDELFWKGVEINGVDLSICTAIRWGRKE